MLFSGTPCQVDGLYHYLGEHPEKLLTCDVLCRGVCSPGVWAKLVQSMAYIKRKQPVAVNSAASCPASRSAASRYGSTTATFDSPLSKSEFGRGFSETSSCARPVTPVPMPPWTGPAICRWAFYGLPKGRLPQEQRSGVSLLLVNTPHGAHVFDTLP